MRRGDDNSRMKRSSLLVALLLVAAAWPGDAFAQGCAMCGTVLQNAHDPLARSMASSILFMLSMPFLLFFSVAGWLVYRFRRGAKSEENPS